MLCSVRQDAFRIPHTHPIRIMLRAQHVSPDKADNNRKHLANHLVRVEFREASSRELLLVRHIDPAELPESFAPHTEIDLGLGIWEVKKASPQSREEFSSSRELTLWIARATTNATTPTHEEEDASATPEYEVLFAPQSQHPLPERLSAMETRSKSDGEEARDLLYLYEEDWLTNQLLPASSKQAIRKEFGLIARTPMGMTHRLHHHTPQPIHAALTLDTLAEALDAGFFDDLVLCQHSRERVVSGGFALESDLGTIFYGDTDPDDPSTPITLGIHYWEDTDTLIQDLERIAHIEGITQDSILFISWNSQSMLTLKEAIDTLNT